MSGKGGQGPFVHDIAAAPGSAYTDQSAWAKREDGSDKGTGWLGLLRRPDGGVSSEISVGVNIGGKDMEIPTMVPTLTRHEINTLLSLDPEKDKIPRPIINKAVDYASRQTSSGQPVFAPQGYSYHQSGKGGGTQ